MRLVRDKSRRNDAAKAAVFDHGGRRDDRLALGLRRVLRDVHALEKFRGARQLGGGDAKADPIGRAAKLSRAMSRGSDVSSHVGAALERGAELHEDIRIIPLTDLEKCDLHPNTARNQ